MLKHGFLEGIKDNLGRPVSVFLKLSAFRSLTLESQSNVQCVKELTMVQLSVGMATGAAYLGSKVAGHYLPRWGSMYIIFLIRLIFVMTEECIYVYPPGIMGRMCRRFSTTPPNCFCSYLPLSHFQYQHFPSFYLSLVISWPNILSSL